MTPGDPPSGRPPLPAILLGAMVGLLGLMVIGGVLLAPRLAGPGKAGRPLPRLGSVPDFSLTERSGRTVSRDDLLGRVWIADLVFTRCAGVCIAMSLEMAELQEKTAIHPGIRLVSFTVDPEFDTPVVLSAYARRWGADPERWLFLTGDPAAIRRVALEGFRLAFERMPDAPAGQEVLHSDRFALVDPAGTVRGYYDPSSDADSDRLMLDLQTLLP